MQTNANRRIRTYYIKESILKNVTDLVNLVVAEPMRAMLIEDEFFAKIDGALNILRDHKSDMRKAARGN